MSRDLDTRARQAAAGLKAAVSEAELTSVPPTRTTGRSALITVLRPAWIIALLLIGSAVGVAMVLDSSPTPTTAPPVTNTTVVSTTAVPSTTPPSTEAPPTTAAAVVPVAPTSTTAPADIEPPILEITAPENGATFDEEKLTFSGITEPGARVFAGPYEADVEPSGEWHIVLILSKGKNVASFVARDAAGNESEASVTVFYVVEPETTTTTEKELAEFSANFTFGSCSETPPYDVYYGTGEPGSWIEISSEYGSAEVVVAENGEWETDKVFFEGAPADEPFGVRISDQYGRVKELQFVYKP